MRVRLWNVPLTILLTLAAAPATAAAADDRTNESEAAHEPQPLERFFDNKGVSHPSDTRTADFDGAGNSLPAQDLEAAGWCWQPSASE